MIIVINDLIQVTNDLTYRLRTSSTCTLERRRDRTRCDSWTASVRQGGKTVLNDLIQVTNDLTYRLRTSSTRTLERGTRARWKSEGEFVHKVLNDRE